ncbi:MAG TPA: adenylate/guanylate cyclase domain-containing protein [Actinomycetota bacterium]|nr:adenylate/guanylate cyclase domain-containing protein [Actinomycetota bacterium]
MPRFRRCGGILVGNGAARAKSWPSAGHVGVAAGPVVANGGDYFGRTVNLASRIAGRAGTGQVLVSESVANAAVPDVRFVELGEVNLKGFTKPAKVFEPTAPERLPRPFGRWLDPRECVRWKHRDRSQ